MSRTEVTVDYEYGDHNLVTEIKAALSSLNINTITQSENE